MKINSITFETHLHRVSALTKPRLLNPHWKSIMIYTVRDNNITYATDLWDHKDVLNSAQQIIDETKPDAIIYAMTSCVLFGTSKKGKDGLFIHGSTPEQDVALITTFDRNIEGLSFEEPFLLVDPTPSIFENAWINRVTFH